jgi:hypothetical protein
VQCRQNIWGSEVVARSLLIFLAGYTGNIIGEVAKRSNAADCKSVALAASEVRILPSPPTFAAGAFAEAGCGWQANETRRRLDVNAGSMGVAGVPAEGPRKAQALEQRSGLARRSGEQADAARAAEAGVTQW